MQFNSHKFNQNSNDAYREGEIEQYFGNGNLFEQQKVSGGNKPIHKVKEKVQKKKPFSFISTVEHIPMEQNRGFLVLLITLGMMFAFLVFFQSWLGAFNTVLLGAMAFVFWKKASFELRDSFFHYLSNATVTWKALLKQTPYINQLSPYSRHILFFSVLTIGIREVFLNLFLSPSFTSFLYAIASFGLLMGIGLCFGNKEYGFIYQALKLYSLMLLLQMILFVLLFGHMPVLSVVTFMFYWSVSSLMKQWETIQREFEKKTQQEVSIVVGNDN